MKKLNIDPSLLLELTEEKTTIDNLVDQLDERHAFDGETAKSIFRAWKKYETRRAVKQVKKNGIPLIFSIVDLDPITGKSIRKYKQELLFVPEDYRQVIQQYRNRRLYNQKIEKHLMKRLAERFPDAPLFEAA